MKTTITLDRATAELFRRIAAQANLSIDDIGNRLLSSHLSEMHELEAFLEENPAGSDSLHERGLNLIQSYGPESIMDGIARVAPAGYATLAARFEREMNEVIGTTATPPQ
ncbi:MAG: hypothetical protein H7232_12130 [Aeromicrobium sp.]|nr:hypothetical protein [Burkholderiales bacterium]